MEHAVRYTITEEPAVRESVLYGYEIKQGFNTLFVKEPCFTSHHAAEVAAQLSRDKHER